MLDTSAFIAGFDPFSINEEQYTVPMVKEELSENSMASVRFKIAVSNGKLKVQTPDPTYQEKLKASATSVGDTFFLSEADHQVLALALQLKMQGCDPLIATDDYSIQNVAKHLHIKFTSLATFGIRHQLEWVRYCPACKRKYPADHKQNKCSICGTELKRKPLRKPPLSTIEKIGETHGLD